MTLDWTLDIGTILTIIGFVVGGVFIFSMMRADLQHMSKRLMAVEDSISKLTDVLVKVAVERERLDAHDQRIDRLERLTDGGHK